MPGSKILFFKKIVQYTLCAFKCDDQIRLTKRLHPQSGIILTNLTILRLWRLTLIYFRIENANADRYL